MTQTLLKLAADFTVQLTSPVAIGDTTATLTSNVDDDNVALPDGLYGLTIDAGQSNKEYIICTLTGSAVSAVQSVTRQGVATSGFTKAHRRGAKVTITDWAILSRILNNLNGTTNFDSAVPLGYDGAPSSLTGNQFATVNYVLSVVSGGTVTFDQQIISNQSSGEALTINDVVYFKESDQKWYKADADLTATFDQLQLGINKTTAASANTTIQVAISGPVSGFSGLTAGSKYYLSNTAGAITTTPGTNSVFLGWALSTTSFLFNPVLKTLPTQQEKDAMAGGGSFGTPSSTNKFITEDFQTANPPIIRTYLSAASPATWTKPAGLKYIVVEVQGAGGSGGNSTGSVAGGGGGGGGYSKKVIAVGSLGATETVTIGAASVGSGNTSFGSHAIAGNGGNASNSTAGTAGTASSGDLNVNGLAGSEGNTGSGSTSAGRGGSSFLGDAGIPGATSNSTNNAYDGGNGFLGGGGGGATCSTDGTPTASGGSGGIAIVIVTEYYS